MGRKQTIEGQMEVGCLGKTANGGGTNMKTQMLLGKSDGINGGGINSDGTNSDGKTVKGQIF